MKVKPEAPKWVHSLVKTMQAEGMKPEQIKSNLCRSPFFDAQWVEIPQKTQKIVIAGEAFNPSNRYISVTQ